MLVKCGFGSQKTAKSTLKRSYLSSRFFESVLHLNREGFESFQYFSMVISGVGQKLNLVVIYDDFDF